MGGGANFSAPQNLAAVNEDQNIALTWDAVDGATVYRLLVNSVDDINTAWEEAYNIAATSYDFAPELDNGGAADSINVGQKAYFWVAVNDGTTGVSLSDPSASASGRAFITVAFSGTVNVRAPADSGQTVGTVCFGSAEVPSGSYMQIGANVNQYIGGGVWVDIITEEETQSNAVTGSFTFINGGGAPFTFWNTEP